MVIKTVAWKRTDSSFHDIFGRHNLCAMTITTSRATNNAVFLRSKMTQSLTTKISCKHSYVWNATIIHVKKLWKEDKLHSMGRTGILDFNFNDKYRNECGIDFSQENSITKSYKKSSIIFFIQNIDHVNRIKSYRKIDTKLVISAKKTSFCRWNWSREF